MIASALERQKPRVCFEYSAEVEAEIEQLGAAIRGNRQLAGTYDPRWLAIQLLEGDETLWEKVSHRPDAQQLLAALAASRDRLAQFYGNDVDVALVNRRYEFVHQVVQQAVVQANRRHSSKSDQIDRIVTHPIWGIPIFLALMWVVFKVTIDVTAPFLDRIDWVMTGPITNWTAAVLGAVGLGGTWVESLTVDGVIAGVGGVLVFVPVMFALYLVLAVLEDCGYMVRAALVMDRLMRRVGLQGKSFLPMVVGFGCSVPAIYATRTLEHRRDRILTGLLVPFMSCSARLPVYILFAAIFFPQFASLAIFAMYLLGILIAVAIGLLLNRTFFRHSAQSHFIMELPPYRLPTARTVWRQMWERTSSFIRNAWTLILSVSLVLWLLLALPAPGASGSFAAVPVEDSVFGAVASTVAPVFAPLGFGSWQASGALITGFVAKEVIVATMAQVYHVEPPHAAADAPTTFIEDLLLILTNFVQAILDTVKSIPLMFGIDLFDAQAAPAPTGLMNAVQADFAASSGGHGALAGVAFMVFVLLYTPCMAAVAAEKHELGTKWMWVSVVGQLAIAWLVAFFVFQGGLFLLG